MGLDYICLSRRPQNKILKMFKRWEGCGHIKDARGTIVRHTLLNRLVHLRNNEGYTRPRRLNLADNLRAMAPECR